MSDSCLYEKLIGCALNQETSDLSVSPTILGERHNPICLGQVTNISASNLSLGHVTRALCRGILDNITSMMPAEHLQQAGVSRIVGSGSALARNEVLRQEVEKAFPQLVVYGQNADSAVGVAMVLCDQTWMRPTIHERIPLLFTWFTDNFAHFRKPQQRSCGIFLTKGIKTESLYWLI